MVKPIIIAGGPGLKFQDVRAIYQKTTNDIEKVRGLVGQKGTDANQLKILASKNPTVIFDTQRSWVPYVNGKFNSYYAEHMQPVDFITIVGGMIVNLRLKGTIAAVLDATAYAEVNTGLITDTDNSGANPVIGKFAETKGADASEQDVYILLVDVS